MVKLQTGVWAWSYDGGTFEVSFCDNKEFLCVQYPAHAHWAGCCEDCETTVTVDWGQFGNYTMEVGAEGKTMAGCYTGYPDGAFVSWAASLFSFLFSPPPSSSPSPSPSSSPSSPSSSSSSPSSSPSSSSSSNVRSAFLLFVADPPANLISSLWQTAAHHLTFFFYFLFFFPSF
jgi:hypothetical protein